MKTLLAALIVVGVGYFFLQNARHSKEAEAIAALDALNAAAKVGLPLAEYSRRTIDAAVIVDRVAPDIRDPQHQAAVQAIMECYTLARDF